MYLFGRSLFAYKEYLEEKQDPLEPPHETFLDLGVFFEVFNQTHDT